MAQSNLFNFSTKAVIKTKTNCKQINVANLRRKLSRADINRFLKTVEIDYLKEKRAAWVGDYNASTCELFLFSNITYNCYF